MISVIDCGGANLQSVTYAIDKLKIKYNTKNFKYKKNIKILREDNVRFFK